MTVTPLTATGTSCLSRDVRPANAVLVPLAEASRKRGVASTATIVKHRLSLAANIEKDDDIQCLPGRTRLETLKVGLATRRQYLTMLWLLASWAMGTVSTTQSGDPNLSRVDACLFLKEHEDYDEVLDDMTAGYLDQAFWEGAQSFQGGRLMSALGWLLPRHQRQGTGALPRMHQARMAAIKRAPGGTRLPLPEEIVYALCMTICYIRCTRNENFNPAIALLLAYHCYLRPGELARIRWEYLVPSKTSLGSRTVVTLHPIERAAKSKTGDFDETVEVDLGFLAELLNAQRLLHRAGEPFLEGNTRKLQALLDEAQCLMGVEAVLGRQTLYVLRHSGASVDTWLRRRTQDELQRRGRWKSSVSIRRYEKGGRLVERLHRFPAATMAFAESSMTKLGKVLQGRCAPLRPPSLRGA